MLLFRVEPENETILVEQVLEESPVVTGFDNCGTDPEPELVNEGKLGLSIKPLPCLL